jgi:hypothetical protein
MSSDSLLLSIELTVPRTCKGRHTSSRVLAPALGFRLAGSSRRFLRSVAEQEEKLPHLSIQVEQGRDPSVDDLEEGQASASERLQSQLVDVAINTRLNGELTDEISRLSSSLQPVVHEEPLPRPQIGQRLQTEPKATNCSASDAAAALLELARLATEQRGLLAPVVAEAPPAASSSQVDNIDDHEENHGRYELGGSSS